MEIIEAKDIREGLQIALREHPKLTKYRLAKDLNLSSSSHVNNYLTGVTKKARIEVLAMLYKRYNILVEDYKESPQYRKLIAPKPTEIKV